MGRAAGVSGGPRRRLFFAVWPDAHAADALDRIAQWCEHRCGGQAVARDRLHLTLLFLGELNARQTALAQRAGAGVLGHCALRFERVEFWPRAGVLAAVPGAPVPALERAAAALRAALGRDLPLAREPFSAHVTLVRRAQALSELPITPVDWRADALALVESARDRTGAPVYTPLEVWPAV